MPNKIFNDQLEDLFVDLKNDPEFQDALADLEPGYQIADHRLSKGLTQKELAELAGTSQSSIARLENGSSPPSLSFLRRVAKALDAHVAVKLVSNERVQTEEDNQRALFTTINYLHEDSLADIKRGKFADARQKLKTLIKLIQKCQSTQELMLISDIINREINILDQFAEININSAMVDSTI